MRAAIYARYSTNMQSAASIEDQVRVCREQAKRMGWNVVETFSDAAISGATILRPGLQAALAAARRGEFEILLAEALDRISRDQEDVAGCSPSA
jgi:DNA invertase Pin-like site-specific DNA recombinase